MATLLHHEDARIPERIARFAVTMGMAQFVHNLVHHFQHKFRPTRRGRCAPGAVDPHAFGTGKKADPCTDEELAWVGVGPLAGTTTLPFQSNPNLKDHPPPKVGSSGSGGGGWGRLTGSGGDGARTSGVRRRRLAAAAAAAAAGATGTTTAPAWLAAGAVAGAFLGPVSVVGIAGAGAAVLSAHVWRKAYVRRSATGTGAGTGTVGSGGGSHNGRGSHLHHDPGLGTIAEEEGEDGETQRWKETREEMDDDEDQQEKVGEAEMLHRKDEYNTHEGIVSREVEVEMGRRSISTTPISGSTTGTTTVSTTPTKPMHLGSTRVGGVGGGRKVGARGSSSTADTSAPTTTLMTDDEDELWARDGTRDRQLGDHGDALPDRGPTLVPTPSGGGGISQALATTVATVASPLAASPLLASLLGTSAGSSANLALAGRSVLDTFGPKKSLAPGAGGRARAASARAASAKTISRASSSADEERYDPRRMEGAMLPCQQDIDQEQDQSSEHEYVPPPPELSQSAGSSFWADLWPGMRGAGGGSRGTGGGREKHAEVDNDDALGVAMLRGRGQSEDGGSSPHRLRMFAPWDEGAVAGAGSWQGDVHGDRGHIYDENGDDHHDRRGGSSMEGRESGRSHYPSGRSKQSRRSGRSRSGWSVGSLGRGALFGGVSSSLDVAWWRGANIDQDNDQAEEEQEHGTRRHPGSHPVSLVDDEEYVVSVRKE